MQEKVQITNESLKAAYDKYSPQFDVCLGGTSGDERQREAERVITDFINVTETSDFSPSEYFMYDFAHKERCNQGEFLPEKATLDLFYRFNNPKSIEYNTRNKWKVYQYLKPYYKREICLVTGLEHKEPFYKLLKEKGMLFCKPLCGSLGEKTRIVKNTERMSGNFFEDLLEYYAPEGFLTEEVIHQTEFMMRLNPTSVNTLRIMTIRLDNRICMYFEFKIGEMFSIVDNLGKRSLICGVDEKDGTIISAFNKNRSPFEKHPHTQAQVVGAVIPRFSEAVELAKELARYYPGYRYLSWDLALTDEGWVIVELNGKGGVCGFQEVYNCGIRRDMEEYLSELDCPTDFSGTINEGYAPLPKSKNCPHAEYKFTL